MDPKVSNATYTALSQSIGQYIDGLSDAFEVYAKRLPFHTAHSV